MDDWTLAQTRTLRDKLTHILMSTHLSSEVENTMVEAQQALSALLRIYESEMNHPTDQDEGIRQNAPESELTTVLWPNVPEGGSQAW